MVMVEEEEKPDPENGSNNWAVSGSKTKSGSPILCNDPHLGLNLPSLWYEIQLSTPSFNAYGVSFPGSPGVIIGYNDSCAFGFTNGGRDVKDYYEIKFRDDSRREYWFNNAWTKSTFRVDTIKIKGKPDFIDSVAYTVFGPVMYDKSYSGGRKTNDKYYALRWKAHDPSNEMKIFYMLNHAKNYSDYLEAVTNLHTPGQNCVFACKNGDIAIRTQGEWPAKWKGQGDFVMPGTDSSYMWQGMIPQSEIPFQYNPSRGFVSSANQKPVDDVLSPYYLGRNYPPYRGYLINKKLTAMNNITPDDMKNLQTDNTNGMALLTLPLILKHMPVEKLSPDENKYFDILKNWNGQNGVTEKGATVFEVFWPNFEDTLMRDEMAKATGKISWPFESTVAESLLKDTAWKFIDNINTPEKETLKDILLAAFKKSCSTYRKAEAEGKLEWAKFKGTHIDHLTKLPSLSRLALPIGGGVHVINATKEVHGPSWRMVINLTKETEAYGVYPGGQSGNPGSRYYDMFIDQWAAGKYFTLWMMKKGEEKDGRIMGKLSFGKSNAK
jgi:penicillin amidase